MLALPGSGPLAEILARDPLRLQQIAFEGTSAGSGLRAQLRGNTGVARTAGQSVTWRA